MIVMELQNVAKIYRMEGVKVNALQDVSLKIEKGEFVSITGPSGCGKSTLMHILGLLDIPTFGEVMLDNERVDFFDDNKLAKLRNIKIGFVFQSFNLLPRTSSLGNVELPLIYSNIKDRKRHEMSFEVLKTVGLGERLNHFPSQLSGGEKQRVAIARALVNNPSIILADEPTGNLDSKSGKEILEIFKLLNKNNNTIVLVTHDKDIARMAQRIIKMKDGKIV